METKNENINKNFAIKVQNNAKEIVDYLVNLGYNRGYCDGNARNNAHYYIIDDIIRCTGSNIQDKKVYTLQQYKELRKNSKNKVIHVKTQQEWDFATEKLGKRWSYNWFTDTKEKSTIFCNDNIRGNINHAKALNYQIISFEDWCKENNYTFTKIYTKDDFIVGKWYKIISNFNLEKAELLGIIYS